MSMAAARIVGAVQSTELGLASGSGMAASSSKAQNGGTACWRLEEGDVMMEGNGRVSLELRALHGKVDAVVRSAALLPRECAARDQQSHGMHIAELEFRYIRGAPGRHGAALQKRPRVG